MLEAIISLKRTGVGGSLVQPDLEVEATVSGKNYADLAYNLVEYGGEFLESVLLVALKEEEAEEGKSVYDRKPTAVITDENYWFLAIEIPNPKTGENVRTITHVKDVQSVLVHCINSSKLLYELLWGAIMSSPQHRKRGLQRWTPVVIPSPTVLKLTSTQAVNYIPTLEKFADLDELVGVQLRLITDMRGTTRSCLNIQVAKSSLALLP